MKTDLRRYGYWDYEPLINKESQMMTYLDGKFSGIDVKVDTGAIADAVDDTVKKTLDSNQAEMDEKFRRISREIARSTDVIIHTPRPCPAHPGPQPHHHHHPHHCETAPLNEEDCFYTDLNLDVIREKNDFRERASNW